MFAADPLFVHLAGGSVPSIDILYDDLRRFDAQALEDLEPGRSAAREFIASSPGSPASRPRGGRPRPP
jgi:hypothetical protein